MTDTPEQAASRAAFEAFITAPPFELSAKRYPDDANQPWPGTYIASKVDLAWCAWQAGEHIGRFTAPRPRTCGLCGAVPDDGDLYYRVRGVSMGRREDGRMKAPVTDYERAAAVALRDPRCPWCGKSVSDAPDHDLPIMRVGQEWDVDCGACGGPVAVLCVDVRVTYNARKR